MHLILCVREVWLNLSSCGWTCYHQFTRGLLSEQTRSHNLGGTWSNVTSEYLQEARTFTGITAVFWLWTNVNSFFFLRKWLPPEMAPSLPWQAEELAAGAPSPPWATSAPSQSLCPCSAFCCVFVKSQEHLCLWGAFRNFKGNNDGGVGVIIVIVDF